MEQDIEQLTIEAALDKCKPLASRNNNHLSTNMHNPQNWSWRVASSEQNQQTSVQTSLAVNTFTNAIEYDDLFKTHGTNFH